MALVTKFVSSEASVRRERNFFIDQEDLLVENTLTTTLNSHKNLCASSLTEYEAYFHDLNKRENILNEILSKGTIKTIDNISIAFYQNFVVKFPPSKNHRLIGAQDRMCHEAFIGLNVANALRSQGIYNFVWTHFFQRYLKKTYLLLENILGVTLNSCITTLSAEELISICNQLYCALAMAYEQYKFTHYDLHGNNIMIVKVADENIYLKYHIDGENVFVSSPGILAVIIDYESSYAEIDGLSYGTPLSISSWSSTEEINRYTDRSFPQSDIYRFMSVIAQNSPEMSHLLKMWLTPHIEEELQNTQLNVDQYMQNKYNSIPDTPTIRAISPLEMFREIGVLLNLPIGYFDHDVSDYLACYDEPVAFTTNTFNIDSSKFLERLNGWIQDVLERKRRGTPYIVEIALRESISLRESAPTFRELFLADRVIQSLLNGIPHT